MRSLTLGAVAKEKLRLSPSGSRTRGRSAVEAFADLLGGHERMRGVDLRTLRGRNEPVAVQRHAVAGHGRGRGGLPSAKIHRAGEGREHDELGEGHSGLLGELRGRVAEHTLGGPGHPVRSGQVGVDRARRADALATEAVAGVFDVAPARRASAVAVAAEAGRFAPARRRALIALVVARALERARDLAAARQGGHGDDARCHPGHHSGTKTTSRNSANSVVERRSTP